MGAPVTSKTIFLYVMECEGFVKVGISREPEKRARSMTTHNPFPVTLRFRRSVPIGYAAQAEHHAHMALKAHHHRNEWFRCSIKEAAEAMISGIREAGRIGRAEVAAERNREREAKLAKISTDAIASPIHAIEIAAEIHSTGAPYQGSALPLS